MTIAITLQQPLSINECGKRAVNEDSVYPPPGVAQKQDRLFMVCDGVGGSAKGEIASRLVCETFAEAFDRLDQHAISDAPLLQSVLSKAEDALHTYTRQHPESQGMATTLTLLHFHEKGATAAHIGDSRIYHIRKGAVLYRSEDHSFVQGLVKSGIITLEEARTHPKRNVITRAVQGVGKAVKADVHLIKDIAADDYFFLCSDGILESVSEAELCALLDSEKENAGIIQEIKNQCSAYSRDNFSAYLVKVERVNGALAKAGAPSPQKKSAYRFEAAPVLAENRTLDSDFATVITSHPVKADVSSNAFKKEVPENPALSPKKDDSYSKYIFIIIFIFLFVAIIWFILK